MRRKRRRRRRRHKRVCGDNAASRELRETVSLTQLDRTRAPLYSALLPLSATACGDPATKAFLVFDTANCIHPTLPKRPSACPRTSLENRLLPPSRGSACPSRETNREIVDVRERKKKGKKKERRVVVQSAQGGCSYSQSLPPVQ